MIRFNVNTLQCAFPSCTKFWLNLPVRKQMTSHNYSFNKCQNDLPAHIHTIIVWCSWLNSPRRSVCPCVWVTAVMTCLHMRTVKSTVEKGLVAAMDDTCMVNSKLPGMAVQFYTTTCDRQESCAHIFCQPHHQHLVTNSSKKGRNLPWNYW